MSLTPAQQMQLCTDVTNYTVNNISKANGCKFAGVESAIIVYAFDPSMTDADLQSACSQAVTQCNSAPPDTSGGNCDFSGVATCSADATIGDFNTCASAEVTAESAAFASLPACSAITGAWITANADTVGTISEPASCVSLDAKCPDVGM
jgi:hypothetical protein